MSKKINTKALIAAMLAEASLAPEPVSESPESPVESMVKSALEVLESQKGEIMSKQVKSEIIKSPNQGLSFYQWFALFLRSALVRGLEVKGSYKAIEGRYLKAYKEGKAVKALLNELSVS